MADKTDVDRIQDDELADEALDDRNAMFYHVGGSSSSAGVCAWSFVGGTSRDRGALD